MRPKSKITRVQIGIIAGVLSLIIAGGIFFGLIKPLNERMEAANAKYTANEPIAAQRSSAEADRKKALADVNNAKLEFARYEKRFFYRRTQAGLQPLVNVSDRLRALQQRWQLQGQSGLGPEVLAFLNRDKSVRITQAGLSIPAPPQEANEAVEELIVLPLGTVAVEGTFDKVLDHTVRWNKFNRLMLVDGLALQGNSPRLAGTYALTCYIFASGARRTGSSVGWRRGRWRRVRRRRRLSWRWRLRRWRRLSWRWWLRGRRPSCWCWDSSVAHTKDVPLPVIVSELRTTRTRHAS
jgi:hypothetical protein